MYQSRHIVNFFGYCGIAVGEVIRISMLTNTP
jgi:hypothetical protein